MGSNCQNHEVTSTPIQVEAAGPQLTAPTRKCSPNHNHRSIPLNFVHETELPILFHIHQKQGPNVASRQPLTFHLELCRFGFLPPFMNGQTRSQDQVLA